MAATLTPAEAGATTTPIVPGTTLSGAGSGAAGGSWLAHAAANAQSRRLRREKGLMVPQARGERRSASRSSATYTLRNGQSILLTDVGEINTREPNHPVSTTSCSTAQVASSTTKSLTCPAGPSSAWTW